MPLNEIKYTNSGVYYNGNRLLTEAEQSNSTNITNINPTSADDNTIGYRVGDAWYNTATETFYILQDATTGNAVWLETPSAGNQKATQNAHGFSVGNVVYIELGTGTFRLAQANSQSTVGKFIISKIIDADNFIYTDTEQVTIPAHGFTTGAELFTSPTIPGQLTETEPTTIGHFSNPMAYVINSNIIEAIKIRSTEIKEIREIPPYPVAGLPTDEYALTYDADSGHSVWVLVDVVLPSLTASSISNIAEVTADLNVTYSEDVTVYFVVVPQGDPAPTTQEIIDGQANGGGVPVSAGEFSALENILETQQITSLTLGTNYTVHFLAIDAVNNREAVANSINFTTLDLTAPTLTASSITDLVTTTADLNVTYDENSTVYFVVVPQADPAPTAQEIIDGQSSGGGFPTTSGDFGVLQNLPQIQQMSTLTPGTNYTVHFLAVDAFNNQSTASSENFATVPLLPIVLDYSTVQVVNPTPNRLLVRYNQTVTVHYIVALQTDPAPTIQEIIDGTGAFGSTIDDSGIFLTNDTFLQVQDFVGLQSATDYTVYFVAEDQYNFFEVVSHSHTFTTPAIGGLPEAFVMELNVTGAYGNTVILPHLDSYNYNYTVDWGDGSPIQTVLSYNDPNTVHNYALPGNYTVTIEGAMETLFVDYIQDAQQLGTWEDPWMMLPPMDMDMEFWNNPLGYYITQITSWGTASGLKRINFSGCINLTQLPAESAGLNGVTSFKNAFMWTYLPVFPENIFSNNVIATDFEGVFANCMYTANAPFVMPNLDTLTEATNLSYAFYNCQALTYIPADYFKNLDKVTTFEGTFESCWQLGNVLTQSMFETNQMATNFNSTFAYCTMIDGVLPRFTSQNAQTFDLTFAGCQTLSGNILSNTFADTNATTSFYGTFQGCNSLIGSIPEDLFAGKPNVVNFDATFSSCSSLTGSIPENLFANNPLVTSFNQTFAFCSSLTGSIPENLFVSNPQVLNFTGTFQQCSSLTGSIPENLFVNNTLVENFVQTFITCTSLTGSIPAGLFANNIAVVGFHYTFGSCTSITGISAGLFDQNVNASVFNYTFSGCSAVTSIPAGLFDNNVNATQFTYTFNGTGIISIPAGLFDQNVLANNFMGIFAYCTSLTAITSNLFDNNPLVTTFSYSFNGCSLITTIPASLFVNNTAVTNFGGVFRMCSGLTAIPAGLFATNTQVTLFGDVFSYCTSLTAIPVGLFDNNTLVTHFSNAFAYCNLLTGVIPAGLFTNNTAVTNFYRTFYRTSFAHSHTGSAPTLWLSHPTAFSTQCFFNNTALSNYASIPAGWK